ncbi:glycosyltransferase family 4 protein [Clostridium sporogenes]|uniref:glycosyltransferase family 4 protein n=1 Tax=Clostridium sporogenes TaxID=1509 RepID=UPI001C0FF695|nr:glycosyltransferase family 4 protein [Clostridium sporogenes]MBU5299932.1 glycosyltransferase family 4 protein [Clostridium sporogenes]
MDNLILIFPYKVEDKEEWNNIINVFDKKNYYVYILNDISTIDFGIGSLSTIIEYYKNFHENINKIVVMSNAKDLIFSWFRAYNSIVDDFIYFIDDEEKNFYQSNEEIFPLIDNLSNLINIDEENIYGKIYINLNINNFRKIVPFIYNNNKIQLFDSLNNFEYVNKFFKQQIVKRYIIGGFEYIFNTSDIKKIQNINLIVENNKKSQVLIETIYKNTYVIPYYILLLTENINKNINDLIIEFIKFLKENIDNSEKEYIVEIIYNYLKNKQCNFKKKVYLCSIGILLYPEYKNSEEFLLNILKNDNDNLDIHYEIIVHSLIYSNIDGVPLYNNYYYDRTKCLDKLSLNYLKLKKNSGQTSCIQNKSIVIITDQLLSIKHSPTKLILDYAKTMKKLVPDYDISIFVEDNLYCKEKESIPYLYTSSKSESCKDIHNDYLDGVDIKIYYANLSDSKKHRTIDMFYKIEDINPVWILSISQISVLLNMLKECHYKIVYLSAGGDYFYCKASKYLCIDKKKIVENNKKYKAFTKEELNNIIPFGYGINLSDEVKKKYERKSFNLLEEDVVLVTVGNRLDVEMDDEYINCMCNILMQNDNVKWIIVGPKIPNIIYNKYNWLLQDKITTIDYEDELNSLYKICDIYVNPRRNGGGYSGAMAMNMGLPVVCTSDSVDVSYYVGKENCSLSLEEYSKEILNLLNNKKYYKLKSDLMKSKIKKCDIHTCIKDLFYIMND